MSMQSLRETLDATEFKTRLHALAESSTQLDMSDLEEIATLSIRIDEIYQICRIMQRARCDETALCVASSVETALLAVDSYATKRGEQHDSTITNDGSVDAWGWSESTREGDMNWRVTIRIIEETDL